MFVCKGNVHRHRRASLAPRFVAEIQRVFFVSPPKAILPLSMLSIKFKTSKT